MVKDEKYWKLVRERAKELNSDKCSKALDVYVDCCYEHDIPYRSGMDVYGNPVTKAEADATFRRCIQSKSKLGRFSPMSWWRWAAVHLINCKGGIWNKKVDK